MVATAVAAPGDDKPALAAADAPHSFVVGVFCTGGQPSALFAIPGEAETQAILDGRGLAGRAEAIWVDLSLFPNNFAPGTFIGMGPFEALPEGAITRNWLRLLPEAVHYYRLNAYMDGRWVELGRGVFNTWNCIAVDHVSCTFDGTVLATFTVLRPSIVEMAGAPVVTWLDLSLFDNGFRPGTFLGAGPFSPDVLPAEEVRWVGLIPNRWHYYRLNTLYGGGDWVLQYFGRFLTPDCAGLPKQYAPVRID